MRDWRDVIQRWVARESRIASLTRQKVEFCAWTISPPSSDQWPSYLPGCEALQDFYRFCDGGYFNWFNWPSLSQLVEMNRKWFELLRDWDKRGDVLLAGQHVVIAEDGGGCPVVWHVTTDRVRAFQFDGGDWEAPLGFSVDEFLTTIFNPEERPEPDWWSLFLQWLDGQLAE
ncbi:SMI1/KNR4 family protein [Dictyobacter aurantiacus]|uniref:Knr4/Smi1-like domain-containing protein n=1 Tax=Dictyobacter aurantiacus TaxID=1936993 RepID=A0A401ZKH7_9CHLR|nr:SMI1/KNR4 family protein [Dictyobacter aurantiacus]GCE07353.1 hypothetical protein KDAU_46820 [Dictyobacter aurantiacus]